MRIAKDGPVLTDEGNYILDLHLKRIGQPQRLALALNQIPGVVENGLFINLCDRVIIGHTDGRVVVRDNHDGSIKTSKVAVAPLGNIFADLGE